MGDNKVRLIGKLLNIQDLEEENELNFLISTNPNNPFDRDLKYINLTQFKSIKVNQSLNSSQLMELNPSINPDPNTVAIRDEFGNLYANNLGSMQVAIHETDGELIRGLNLVNSISDLNLIIPNNFNIGDYLYVSTICDKKCKISLEGSELFLVRSKILGELNLAINNIIEEPCILVKILSNRFLLLNSINYRYLSGYLAGGRTSDNSFLSAIRKLNYYNYVVLPFSFGLSYPISSTQGICRLYVGYIGGGLFSGPSTTNVISKIDFIKETNALLLITLPSNRYGLASLNFDLFGLFIGGSSLSQIIKLLFSDETLSVYVLSLLRNTRQAKAFEFEDLGYIIGGVNDSIYLNTISKLNSGTEVIFDLSAALNQVRSGFTNLKSNLKCYCVAGTSTGSDYLDSIESLTVSDESVNQIISALTTGILGASSLFTDLIGLIVGGKSSGGYVNTILTFSFDNETIFDSSMTLSGGTDSIGFSPLI